VDPAGADLQIADLLALSDFYKKAGQFDLIYGRNQFFCAKNVSLKNKEKRCSL